MDALRIAELFAGVGGFRLGLERQGHQVVFSNQWEPGKKRQWASDCYVHHFGAEGHTNQDIATVKSEDVPDHDILVGGFPCQDYSVATTKAEGIHGKKGVLWWEIYRILREKQPGYLLLENVDRLLRSPTLKRGRDFGVVLWCLQNLGYTVEWRVINAAEYGAPQRRRRTFIFAARKDTPWGDAMNAAEDAHAWATRDGMMARSFPVIRSPVIAEASTPPSARLRRGLQETSDSFEFHFRGSGFARGRDVWTFDTTPVPGPTTTIRAVLQEGAPEQYYIPKAQLAKWKYLKGAKAEPRQDKNGYKYHYTEGALAFPDPLDRPSRTILTSEGGAGPSRFKHIVEDPWTKRMRRLTPLECERLNGFDDAWTATGMPEGWRYFCMGNALVVPLVTALGQQISVGPHRPRKIPQAKV